MQSITIRKRACAASAACAASLATLAVAAPPPGVRFERLDPGSEYIREHCVGACACPSFTDHGRMRGRWVLFPEPIPDPLYEIFNVAVREWTAVVNQQVVRLSGAGRYWRGGEFAITERLLVQLSIDGGAPLTFDSGFVPITPVSPPVIHLTSVTDIVVCDRYSVQIRGALTCEADLDGDARVGFADLNEVLSFFGAHGVAGFVAGDADVNGVVDFSDLNDVLSAFGQTCLFP